MKRILHHNTRADLPCNQFRRQKSRLWVLHNLLEFLVNIRKRILYTNTVIASMMVAILILIPLMRKLYDFSKRDRLIGQLTSDIRGTRIVYVCHDANPHGAQHLSLEICRDLRRMHIVVDMVLLDGGPLLDILTGCASNLLLSQNDDFQEIIERLKMLHQHRYAIANTAVSGEFASRLRENGFTVITLIHEMCDFITERNLFISSRKAVESSILTVFASETVRRNFESCLKPGKGYRGVTRSQGIYSRYPPDESQREIVRKELGLDRESLILLSCGFGDQRKGIDRFIKVAQKLRDQLLAKNSRMLWVGQIHLMLKESIEKEKGLCEPVCIIIDSHVEMGKFYQASDIFILFSREDPYPSVVLEAAYAGLPVLLYRRTTGLEEFIKSNCGSYCIVKNEKEMLTKVRKFVSDPTHLGEMAQKSRNRVALQDSWRKYVFFLLNALEIHPVKVSIVVPSFNSERWIRKRMLSISNQIYPYFELIVFDDLSTDSTIRILNDIQLKIEHVVEKPSVHLGCVFKSWLGGITVATGDLVWIAEADDLSTEHFLYYTIQYFKNPQISFVFSQSNAIDENENIIMPSYIPYMSSAEIGDGFVNSSFWDQSQIISFDQSLQIGFSIKNWIPNVSAIVFRIECLQQSLQKNIEKIGGLSIAGDWYLYYLVLQCGDLAYDKRIMNHHRRRTDSVSSVSHNPVDHLEEVIKVQNMLISGLPRSSVKDIVNYMDKYIIWLFTDYLSQGDIAQLCQKQQLFRHFGHSRFKQCEY